MNALTFRLRRRLTNGIAAGGTYTLSKSIDDASSVAGGGGTVEATTAAGLVVTGGATTTVVTAVLLYRVIGAWGLVPLGWALWLTIPTAPRAQLEPVSA